MNVDNWLHQVAYKSMWDSGLDDEPLEVYRSKYDDSYITCAGLEDEVQFLADREIIDCLTHGVGFSQKHNKWYGWTQRAILGFTIGSTVKKGDCGYTPETPEQLIEKHVAFFDDVAPEKSDLRRAECQILPDRSGIRILPAPLNIPVVDLSDLIDVIENGLTDTASVVDISKGCYEVKCGKGEWTAKTMEDAKQMAIDFNESAS